MFRSTFRSASDPLRDYVCFSCRTRVLRGRAPVRTFRATPLSRIESSAKVAESNITSGHDEAVRNIPEDLNNQKLKVPANSENPPLNHEATDSIKEQLSAEPSTSDNEDHGVADLPSPSGAGRPKKSPVKGASKKPVSKSGELRASSRGFPLMPLGLEPTVTKKEYGKLLGNRLNFSAVKADTAPVPKLSFNLDRVLFNSGVYQLQDHRSRVFNFDPYLGTIMPVSEFDFAALKDYITSSKDTTLQEIASREKKKYVGSSSSMTSVLSHFHYLLSAWRPVNTSMISQGFQESLKTFTNLLRAPAAIILRHKDGVYAIDADKEFDSANILMNLGKSMEKLLTLPKEEFERFRRTHQDKITAEEEALTPESYHYSTQGDFLMRSQLDAYDSRLPGTGMFDLKTRAVVSIRSNARDFKYGLGYQIKDRFGDWESYEREYYDMIRAAFLKYSLQVRMGRMDGIFVAFHNIERIFGFQYISLAEMDLALHGQRSVVLGNTEFKFSIQLWNKILDKATAKYPGRSLRFHFETRLSQEKTTYMNIFYEPVTDEQIEAIQNKNKADIDAYQERLLGVLPKKDDKAVSSTTSDDQVAEETTSSDASASTTISEQVAEETISDDISASTTSSEQGVEETSSNEASTSSTSGDQVSEDTTNTEASKKSDSPHNAATTEKREVSGIYLTVINYHNNQRVERIEHLARGETWSIRYQMCDIEGAKVNALYNACMKHRERLLEGDPEGQSAPLTPYIRNLRRLSRRGRKYREDMDKFDQEKGLHTVD
ncbi:mitochondrial protein Pet127-domain-containing protein [Aspergillus stella-maris]|uniref:mitochondrial protein Pet127-domain-containing protein n=1 Tax=Aspergillus stella-maris TaxID=1810926 RepID=UPI003CCE0209